MKISVIMPVLNEERIIEGTLTRVMQTARTAKAPEVIVVDGGSSDRTRELAGRHADRVLESPQPGRAIQMHAGAQAAKGDVLLFLHADTHLPESWDVALERAWSAHPKPGATAFRLSYDSDRLFYRILARLAHWRSRASQMVHGDQAIAVSRDDYFGVGGFPPVALMEEYYLLPKLRRRGPMVILPDRIRTSVRRYEKNRPLFNAIRNTALIGLHYCGVSADRLAMYYSAPGPRPGSKAKENV